MSNARTTPAKLRKLESVWPESNSAKDAFKRAGIKYDESNARSVIRQGRKEGYELPTINPKHATPTHINCPSTLDIKRARAAKNLVVTSATNNAPIIEPFLEALKLFAKKRNAELIVKPVNYKNLSAMRTTDDYEWPHQITPYALQSDLLLGPKLQISSVNIQATAVNPLSGMEPIGGLRSCIYGHPQLAMKVVAAPTIELPKIMHTTGSISRPRYSDTKEGRKAHFHHTNSAVFIQRKGSKWIPHVLSWDGYGFYYYDEYWNEQGLNDNGNKAAGIVFGDSHVYWENEDVTKLRYKLCKELDPYIRVFHDVLDFRYQNHHNTLIEKIRLASKGEYLVQEEIESCAEYLNDHAGPENWIVRSNHHDAVGKWLNRFRPDHDPHNAPYYFKLMDKVCAGMSGFQAAIEDLLKGKWRFVSGNDKALIQGIDVSNHGDKGINGARGSKVSFAKTSRKSITGHDHTPTIEKGAWGVGCGTTVSSYREGLSTWMMADIIIYPNGKRALIFYDNGEYKFAA